MKLIVAGLGRSGTQSITMALERLGMTSLSQESLFPDRQNHANVNAVLRDKAELNWSMFEGFDAVIGWPLCFLYPKLLAKFPDAKCLLNVRDPESWFDSVERSWKILGVIRNARFIPRFRQINETFDYLQDRFGGPPEKDKWIAAYQDHINSVKEDVKSDRLTIYRVEQGWEPICDLLDVPVPDEDFPRVNMGGEAAFGSKIKTLLVKNRS